MLIQGSEHVLNPYAQSWFPASAGREKWAPPAWRIGLARRPSSLMTGRKPIKHGRRNVAAVSN